MANVYLISGGGNWSNGAVWNTGTVPTAADDVFSNNFTVNVDVSFTVLSLRSTASTPIVAGGSFLFNTAGVTGTVTSSNPLVPGGNNLVQITATTGTVTLSLGGNVSIGITSANLINITGNCNVVLSGGYEFQVGTGSISTNCINKAGNGTLTITGTLRPGNTNTGATFALNITSGTVTVNGSVIGGNGTAGNRGINATTNAVIIVNGNVNGGPGAGIGANPGIFATGVPITINGNVTGGFNSAAVSTDSTLIVTGAVSGGTSAGANAFGISTSGATTIINGNVAATTQSAISSSSANQITINGTVTASSTSVAVSMTNANGQVYLNGNMVNNNGKMAIFAPIVWLDTTGTTSAAFFTSGGVARTLYSADTVPNTPAANNVRSGTIYGAGNSLVGTIVMPVAANVRNGVTYDNGTVGTALFTTSLFLTELSASTVPVAVRMQNLCTPMILGELMEAFKK